uniref:FLYWCH-type domain-containing protein n=1 Tax=Anopheles epiroticus TaxID=199890 RepID=A0A182PMY7_9DIPT
MEYNTWLVVEKSLLQYSTTQRGRTMLIFSGYKFVENRQSKRNIFWRCARYVKHGCRAACVTSKHCNGDPSIRLTGLAHSHPPEDIRPDDQMIVHKARNLLEELYSHCHDNIGEQEEQRQEHNQEHELGTGGNFHSGNGLSFGVSQRGGKKLIYQGYEYIKDREFMLSINWRCALFKRYNCRARAITKMKNGKTYFGVTRRGHQMLLFRGHRYVREKQKGDISNWKCSLHSKFHCKARAVSRMRYGREVMRLTNPEHTHKIF